MNTKAMTFSGLLRHATICDTVLNSSALLSGHDRVELIQELLEMPRNFTVDDVETACKEKEDEVAGHNMINAMILRDAHYGL